MKDAQFGLGVIGFITLLNIPVLIYFNLWYVLILYIPLLYLVSEDIDNWLLLCFIAILSFLVTFLISLLIVNYSDYDYTETNTTKTIENIKYISTHNTDYISDGNQTFPISSKKFATLKAQGCDTLYTITVEREYTSISDFWSLSEESEYNCKDK